MGSGSSLFVGGLATERALGRLIAVMVVREQQAWALPRGRGNEARRVVHGIQHVRREAQRVRQLGQRRCGLPVSL